MKVIKIKNKIREKIQNYKMELYVENNVFFYLKPHKHIALHHIY